MDLSAANGLAGGVFCCALAGSAKLHVSGFQALFTAQAVEHSHTVLQHK